MRVSQKNLGTDSKGKVPKLSQSEDSATIWSHSSGNGVIQRELLVDGGQSRKAAVMIIWEIHHIRPPDALKTAPNTS